MKYFNEKFLYEDLPEEILKKISQDYVTYIENIYSKLPCGFKLLAKGIFLHDGIISEFYWDKRNNVVRLECHCDDLVIGYTDVTITYFEVQNKIDTTSLQPNDEYSYIEIYADEIELLESKYISHKLFFFTKKEIEIISKNVAITVQPKSKKEKKEACKVIIIE